VIEEAAVAVEEAVAEEAIEETPVAEEAIIIEETASEIAEEPVEEEPVEEEPVEDEPVEEEPVAEEAPVQEARAAIIITLGRKANVYAEPTSGSKVLDTLEAETEVRLIAQEGDWAKVALKDGQIGFIHKTALCEFDRYSFWPEDKAAAEEPVEEEIIAEEPIEEEPVEEELVEEEVIDTPQAVVLVTVFLSGRVHAEANHESDVLATLSNETDVELVMIVGDWAKVRLADGRIGYIYKTNLYDRNLFSWDEIEIEDYETPLGLGDEAIPYAFEKDEDGNLILDENGNPFVTVYGGAEIPVTYQRNEDGSLVLDENGNPIPTQTVPADAYKVMTLEDLLNPDRTIDVYASWNNEIPALGGTVTFVGILNGYENLEYTVQWQQSSDNETWHSISGANDLRYSVVITEDNLFDYWRVQVTVTGIAAE
jgi:SH3-like domain-containing protein